MAAPMALTYYFGMWQLGSSAKICRKRVADVAIMVRVDAAELWQYLRTTIGNKREQANSRQNTAGSDPHYFRYIMKNDKCLYCNYKVLFTTLDHSLHLPLFACQVPCSSFCADLFSPVVSNSLISCQFEKSDVSVKLQAEIAQSRECRPLRCRSPRSNPPVWSVCFDP